MLPKATETVMIPDSISTALVATRFQWYHPVYQIVAAKGKIMKALYDWMVTVTDYFLVL